MGEIKSDVENAVAQNVEQMIGVLREEQIVMLGFTCNPDYFAPRILVRNENTIKFHRRLFEHNSRQNRQIKASSINENNRDVYVDLERSFKCG